MRCSICQRQFTHDNTNQHGHNAQPVNDGRCCDTCNYMVVLPARMQIHIDTYPDRTINPCQSN